MIEIGGDEDGVPHIGGDPRGDIAGPGQRVQTVVLDNSIERDRKAVQDQNRNKPAELHPAPQPGQNRKEDHQITKQCVRSLEALIRTDQASEGDQGAQRADKVDHHSHEGRENERGLHGEAKRASPLDGLIDHTGQPEHGHHHSQGA